MHKPRKFQSFNIEEKEKDTNDMDAISPGDEILLSKLSYFNTSISNYSVQYNYQAVGPAMIIMATTVCTLNEEDCLDGHQAPWVKATLSSSVFFGSILGQLTMGYLGDIVGRDKALILTLILAVIGALFSAILPTGSPETIYSIIIISRFILGIGVGGVYPLSATKAAESKGPKKTKTENDNKHMKKLTTEEQKNEDLFNKLAVMQAGIIKTTGSFIWQSPGAASPWLLGLFLSGDNGLTANQKWRIIFGLGAVPAFLVIICTHIEQRIRYPKGLDRYTTTSTVSPKTLKATNEEPKEKATFWDHLKDPINQRRLLVSGGCWFLYDVCYYGVSMFSSSIVQYMSPTYTSDDVQFDVSSDGEVSHKSLLIAIAYLLGIPAIAFTIYLMLLGYSIKTLQIMGFFGIAGGASIFAGLFYSLRPSGNLTNLDAMFAVFCLFFFLLFFGTKPTAFALPAAIYPKKIRSTFNGISAALGKFGAAVGAFLFPLLNDLLVPVPAIMSIVAVCALLGAYITHTYLNLNGNDDDNDDAGKNSDASFDHNEPVHKVVERISSVRSTIESRMSLKLISQRRSSFGIVFTSTNDTNDGSGMSRPSSMPQKKRKTENDLVNECISEEGSRESSEHFYSTDSNCKTIDSDRKTENTVFESPLHEMI